MPEQVFALIDIGAGTSDIAIMARFGGKDSILAQDSVAQGGRLLKQIADRVAKDRFGTSEISEAEFQDLLRDGQLSLTGGDLTTDMVFAEPDAQQWLNEINSCLLQVKTRAQKINAIRESEFVGGLANNTYVAGGIGRSEIVGRKILQRRVDAPKKITIPAACEKWAVSVGPEATGLFLQLAPSVGALSISANTSSDVPPPIVIPTIKRRGFEHEDTPG